MRSTSIYEPIENLDTKDDTYMSDREMWDKINELIKSVNHLKRIEILRRELNKK